jgi:endoglucanase
MKLLPLLASIALLLPGFAAAEPEPPKTPFATHGSLQVSGTHLCDQTGKPIQLRGMSTHGLQWYGWGKSLTPEALDALANDWKADILRVSLYVQEGGYQTNPKKFTEQVDTIVEEATKRGLYVLIDWHMLDPGDPMLNLERAKEYFTQITQRHGKKGNLLYEIANEPNGTYKDGDEKKHRVDWSRIKSYAEALIPVIRSGAPESVIIVGTPDWSSFGVSGDHGPKEVYQKPLEGKNLMYTFHFYAADHGAEYRKALDEASDKLPVFVTEWGSQEASGDGPNDFESAQAYLDLMAKKKISWTNWNYSDDHRSGAVFRPGTCPKGPWTGASLKEAGKWVQERMRSPN